MTIMNKTYTPELAPEVLLRLGDYAEGFQDLYHQGLRITIAKLGHMESFIS